MPPARRTLHSPRSVRLTRLAAGGLALAAAAACADAPSAPAAPPAALGPAAAPARQAATTPTAAVTARVLARSTPLPHAVRVLAVVGAGGGTFTVPQTGLTVRVPAGALKRPTTLTVTAPAGAGVWYEFGPSGTTFAAPLTLTQDLRATTAGLLAPATPLEAGYFVDGTLDPLAGTAPVHEFLPVTFNATRTALAFQVTHFSGYMVSTGRADRDF